MQINFSQIAFEQAKQVIPGGVNSPVRAFGSINGNPHFIKKAKGAFLYDLDDNSFIDYCLSWGVFIQGHASEYVHRRIVEAAGNGTSFGAPSIAETQLARIITKHIPSMQQIRLVNSGTEAVMSAIRLARAYTGRDLIIKFDGCYHGHSDALLINAGSGLAGKYHAASAGVPKDVIKNTISIPFNQPEELQKIFEASGSRIAALIVEPVPANMGLIIPLEGYLKEMELLCRKHGSLLIFDEVITGFRTYLGGIQSEFEIEPDITCLGKIIGGGFPVAAYGASKEIMKLVSPMGPVYQAGTLSGNPVAVAAGLATFEILESDGFYVRLNMNAEWFGMEMEKLACRFGFQFHRVKSMFSIFFTSTAVNNYADAIKADHDKFRAFYLRMLENGIYLSPSPYETNFISASHTWEDLNRTLEIAESSLTELKQSK